MKQIITVIKAHIKSIVGYILFGMCRIFPLEKKVVFSNFSGKCYGDSPKYVAEKLHELDPTIPIIWLKRKDYEFKTPDYIRTVRWKSPAMVWELSTAKVWVDSHKKANYVKKRKGQFYVETSHGTLPLKKVDGDAADKFDYYYITNVCYNTKLVDVFLSNSNWRTEQIRRAFYYTGEILECGYPRSDIFFQDQTPVQRKVRQSLGLEPDVRLLLYMPTFRDSMDDSWLDLDFEKLHEALTERFGGKWIILVKLHPVMKHLNSKILGGKSGIMDVSHYEDSQELILVSEVFITDYSSAIFDFAMTRRPAFIYASDEMDYLDERGTYFDIHDLPFPFSDTTARLTDDIAHFDERKYQKSLDAFFNWLGMKADGTASETVAKLILEKLND